MAKKNTYNADSITRLKGLEGAKAWRNSKFPPR